MRAGAGSRGRPVPPARRCGRCSGDPCLPSGARAGDACGRWLARPFGSARSAERRTRRVRRPRRPTRAGEACVGASRGGSVPARSAVRRCQGDPCLPSGARAALSAGGAWRGPSVPPARRCGPCSGDPCLPSGARAGDPCGRWLAGVLGSARSRSRRAGGARRPQRPTRAGEACVRASCGSSVPPARRWGPLPGAAGVRRARVTCDAGCRFAPARARSRAIGGSPPSVEGWTASTVAYGARSTSGSGGCRAGRSAPHVLGPGSVGSAPDPRSRARPGSGRTFRTPCSTR